MRVDDVWDGEKHGGNLGIGTAVVGGRPRGNLGWKERRGGGKGCNGGG